MFDEIKNLHEPVLLHIKTKKGKGYQYAENNPTLFHGVGKFDKNSGIVKKSSALTYSKVTGNKLIKIANKNDMVILAGKGHETYQEINGKKYPFDERVIIKQIIEGE